MADLKFEPYKLPVEDIFKALNPPPPPPPWKPVVGELAQLIMPVKVFRDFGNGFFDVHDDEGNCTKISKHGLHKPFIHYFKDNAMKAMKDAVSTVAKGLCKANNTVTTLEIKLELRRDYPYYFWTQQAVSDYMSQLAGDGVFTYTDNGTYRVYSLATPAQIAQTAGPVSKQLAQQTITTSTGGGIAKVAGTLPTQAPKRGRGRPRKNGGLVIDRNQAWSMADDAAFESMSINGKVITRSDIRAQKKSPIGYLSSAKLAKMDAITVSGTTYQVK